MLPVALRRPSAISWHFDEHIHLSRPPKVRKKLIPPLADLELARRVTAALWAWAVHSAARERSDCAQGARPTAAKPR